jgi:sugar phosphate isomerase/epimerase
MKASIESAGEMSRRSFLGGAAAVAAGAYGLGPAGAHASAQQRAVPKPNSTINGVRLGINVPYSFRGQHQTAEQTLAATADLGLSWVELRGPSIEHFAGAPAELVGLNLGGGGGGGGGGGAGQAAQRTPEEVAAQQAAARQRREDLTRWRLSQSMDRFKELRWKYESAGVNIQLVKFPDLTANLSDDEAAYVFEVAKALGAEAITTEPPVSQAKKIGRWATQHRVMVGYHGHAGGDRERFGQDGSWEQTFFYSPFNGANVDIGHYWAGNNTSPLPFIEEYAHRITNLHIKDRRMNMGPNVFWGEGDSQVAETLRFMRDKGYTFQATIELEHPIPPGGDVLTEIRRMVDFARHALNS